MYIYRISIEYQNEIETSQNKLEFLPRFMHHPLIQNQSLPSPRVNIHRKPGKIEQDFLWKLAHGEGEVFQKY